MARTTVKATYSLPPESIRALARVAERWGVSKSEALARAILAVAQSPGPPDASNALDSLQDAAHLSKTTAAKWVREVRAERRTTQ
ncbi:MAG: hypothetical protein ABI877_17535 [Gemmatimonadaceae bacterium]